MDEISTKTEEINKSILDAKAQIQNANRALDIMDKENKSSSTN